MSKMQEELPNIPYPLKGEYTFAAFVQTKTNYFARVSCEKTALSPGAKYNPLYIYGVDGIIGVGKTHLLHAIGHRVLERQPAAKVLYISSERFINQLIACMQEGRMARFRETFRGLDALLMDDIQYIAGKPATQEEFLHTFNELFLAGKQIVIAGDKCPMRIEGLDEKLKERLASGLIVEIHAPDIDSKTAIMRKKAEENKYPIPDDVIQLLAQTVESNIRGLEGCMARLAAIAALKGVAVDMAFAKETLHEVYGGTRPQNHEKDAHETGI